MSRTPLDGAADTATMTASDFLIFVRVSDGGVRKTTPDNLTFGDSLYVGQSIFHTGDTDTKIVFTDDNIRFAVGGSTYLELDQDAGTIALGTSTDTITINSSITQPPVSLTGTDAITQAEHAGRTCIITGTTAATYTMPEATGTGDTYRFVFAEVNTNNTIFVTADTANADFRGSINILDADANAQTAYPGNAGDDTITLNGTTTGGQIGDFIEFIDIATDVWSVRGQLVCPAGSNVADMFSSAA